MKIYLTEKLNYDDLWAFDDEIDKYSEFEFEKRVWLETFDGTEDSVDKICKILEISRSDIRNAYISKNVTSIDYGAFGICSSLESIKIPYSVKSIDGFAFNHCRSLTSIKIPSSVTSIGKYAFSFCSSLTSIAIPDSVTSMSKWVFYGCTSLVVYTKNPYVIDYCEENNIKYSTKF